MRFVGEKVAAVAAETQEAADEALLLIDVEYEELPAVFHPSDAMEPESPTLHPDMASYPGLPYPMSQVNNVFAENHWTKGEVEQGFRESDLIFEHTFNAQLMHQAYIEPHACVVRVDDSGRAEIWANNKGPVHAAGTGRRGVRHFQAGHHRVPVQHRWRLRRQGLLHGRAPLLLLGSARGASPSRW